MIIIIEGPDGSGKTTLAEKMHKQTGYKLLHRSYPKTEEDKERMMAEYMQVIKSGVNCIFDRSWYSEMVYGPVMRNDSIISYPQMYTLERELTKRGAIVIYCGGMISNMWARCKERGEDYVVDIQKYSQICHDFETLMYDVPHLVPVVTYEYKNL